VSVLAERLPLDPIAPRTARELIGQFEQELDPASFRALRQVVAEVLAACVESGISAGSVMLRVVRAERDVVVEVGFNSDPAVHVFRGFTERDPLAATIAFRLVDRIADRWGVRDDGAWTTVWVLIALDKPYGHRGHAVERRRRSRRSPGGRSGG
jgi:hypothetical protein